MSQLGKWPQPSYRPPIIALPAYDSAIQIRGRVRVRRGAGFDRIFIPGALFTLMIYLGCVITIVFHRKSLYPFVVGIPLAIVVGGSLLTLYPLICGRQDIFLVPLVMMVAAVALDYLFRVDTRRVVVAVFLSLMVWRAVPSLHDYYQSYGKGAVGMLVQRVVAMAAPGDAV